MKHGKNYRNALKKYDSAALFSIPRAVELVKTKAFVIPLFYRISLEVRNGYWYSVKKIA